MGEYKQFQPLTKDDKITVVLYRAGIILSAVLMSAAAVLMFEPEWYASPGGGLAANALLIGLYGAAGLSVFFIHLYVSQYHRFLKNIYYAGLAALAALFVLGKGDPASVIAGTWYGPLFLLPLSGCLGFITAKEAFCFQLIEGYLFAMLLPFYLLLLAVGVLSLMAAAWGLLLLAIMLIVFTCRKAFMPIHCDIGDKSAYS